jgi:hypothetical protein
MTLGDLADIGELVSSVAVIISLVYLAMQVRSNTETSRTTTYQAIVSDFGAVNSSVASSPELSGIFSEALERYQDLEPNDQARMSQLFYMTFRCFENIFYQHRKGYLEEELWIGWARLMVTYFRRPGFQAWWRLRRDVFSDKFAKFLESAGPGLLVASYHDVTHQARVPPSNTGG